MTNEITKQGLIIKAQSGFFWVETGEGIIVCQLRGKLKRGRAMGHIAALGDHVNITISDDGSGTAWTHGTQRSATPGAVWAWKVAEGTPTTIRP